MRIVYWVAQSAGVWSDPNNWSENGPLGVGGAVPPSRLGDTASFTPFRNGNCTVDVNIGEQAVLLPGSIQGIDSIDTTYGYTTSLGGYSGTINFNSKNVYAESIFIGASTTISGISGTTWQGAVTIYALDSSPRSVTGLSVTTRYPPYFIYCTLTNCTFNTSFGIYTTNKGQAWYSTDGGGNSHIDFFPLVGPGGASVEEFDGILDCAAILLGDLLVPDPPPVDLPVVAECAGDLVGAIKLTVPLFAEVGGRGGSRGLIGGTRSGDTFDYRNPAECVLTVNGTPVDFTTPHFDLKTLNISYDGKELTFTEIAIPTYGTATFANEQSVTLQMDLGTGLKTYFRGVIKKRTHKAANNADEIEYLALGLQNLASELDSLGPWGIPQSGYDGQFTAAEVITSVFANNATQLTANGISTTIGVPNQNTIQGRLNASQSFQNSRFGETVKQLVEVDPSKRLFFDDVQNAWIFADLVGSDIKKIFIDLANIDAHNYVIDTTNRFTALSIYSPLQAEAGVVSRQVQLLKPGWDAALEADWTARRGMGLDGAAAFGDGYKWVFRRWLLEQDINASSSRPLAVLVLTNYWKKLKWVPVQCAIDLQNKIIMTNVPIIRLGNPHKKGDAKGPLAAALVYETTDSFPVEGMGQIRVPESGYEGSAYSLFGIEREKKLMVQPNQFTRDYAAAQLEVLKEVILTGDIPIFGDPVEELINLQSRILVTDSSRNTGLIGVLEAFLLKYSYTFGKPGKSTISLSNDRALVARLDLS